MLPEFKINVCMEISSKESSYCVFRSDIQLNINKVNY